MNQNQNRDEIRAKDLWRAKNGMPQDNGNNRTPGGRKKPPRSLLVFGSILAGLLLLGILLKITGFSGPDQNKTEAASIHEDHIAVLYIEGTIGDSDENYNQQYILENIDSMIENDSNEGLMLYVDTPGGGVYESDEVYLKIREYQKETKRPVYAYFASQATSGGRQDPGKPELLDGFYRRHHGDDLRYFRTSGKVRHQVRVYHIRA